jgi:AcrR family transcriptional regulator
VKNNKADRRSQRTRQLLEEALIALIVEKPYDAITVQDVIERANVGRSTFYAHYRDKEDLLAGSFERVLDGLIQHMNFSHEGSPAILPTLELFRHVQAYHHLYTALVWGRGIDVLFKAGQQSMSQIVERRIAALVADGSPLCVPLPILSSYVSGSLATLLKWWLDNKMPYPPERMDEMFQQLVMPGVWAALGKA